MSTHRGNNLNEKKTNVNDEFYTARETVEAGLKKYESFFRGKTVYCNCDHPERSEFCKYFRENFSRLGLKSLIATYYNPSGSSQKVVYNGEQQNGQDNKKNFLGVAEPLVGNGDFRSEECIAILKEADIIVTNPPFSLFRALFSLLVQYDKKFLLICHHLVCRMNVVFPELQKQKVFLEYDKIGRFIRADGRSISLIGVSRWIQNLLPVEGKPVASDAKYNPDAYRVYDNCDAIEVPNINNIPLDYPGLMGVPCTILTEFPFRQFDLCGTEEMGVPRRYMPDAPDHKDDLRLDAKRIFSRIFIKVRSPENKNISGGGTEQSDPLFQQEWLL